MKCMPPRLAALRTLDRSLPGVARFAAGFCLGFSLLLGFPSPATAQSDRFGTVPGGPEGRLHGLINTHRERIGCRALDWHDAAAAVAAARSADMVARGYFDHVTPDGRSVFDELADAGIRAWGSMAENIALTQAGPDAVLELWRESDGHRRNLENCAFTHQGLGERGGVWTQILLAQPRTPGAGTP